MEKEELLKFKKDCILDTTNLYCPEPVMLLHQKIRNTKSGDTIKVIATDPASWRDIPKFCSFLGHKLVKKEKTNSTFEYVIQKK